MPRLPGRESTQKTLKLEDALVASFLMFWETANPRYEKKVCCIEGCDHRIGECEGTGSGPAYVCRDGDIDNVYGLACTHCVDDLLARAS